MFSEFQSRFVCWVQSWKFVWKQSFVFKQIFKNGLNKQSKADIRKTSNELLTVILKIREYFLANVIELFFASSQ